MKKTRTVFALLTILLAIAVSPYCGFADKVVVHDFDRRACYSTCPCDAVGMEAACFACKEECERKFWEDFDRETGDNKTKAK